MTTWFSRHPILVWGLAWGCTALALARLLATQTRSGDAGPGQPWTFLMQGALVWGMAGALAYHRAGRRVAGFGIWAGAFLIGTCLVWFTRTDPPDNHHDDTFYAERMAWAMGMALGPLLGSLIERPDLPWYRRLVSAGLWASMYFGAQLGVPLVAVTVLSLVLGIDGWLQDPLPTFGAATLGGCMVGQLAMILRYAQLGAVSGAD